MHGAMIKILKSNFTNICPVGAELFHADRRADGQDEVGFRTFANASKVMIRDTAGQPYV